MLLRRADAVSTRGQENVARSTIAVYSLASVLTLVMWPLGRFSSGESWVETAGDILNLPLAYGLFGAVLLFLLTGALLRRKRFAVWIVMALQLVGVLLAAALAARSITGAAVVPLRLLQDSGAKVATYAGGLFGVGAGYALWWARSAFPARRSPGSPWATFLTLIIGLSATTALGIVLTDLFAPAVQHPVIRGARAALGVDTLIGVHPTSEHLPRWISWCSSTASAGVLLLAIAVFLRSSRSRQRIDGPTEVRIRKLLLQGGHDDSLGYFATRRDKTVLFSPDGRAGISYRVIASVALASADPLGPKDAWPAAIEGWLHEARTFGWVPAVLSPGQDAAHAYVAAGLRVIPLGDEAVLDPKSFTLAGPAMKAVRQAVVKVHRAGYTVTIRRHRDIPAEEMAQLSDCAERWRGSAPERGFSMALSRLGDPVDGSCLMVVAHGPDGVPAALLSLVPWGRRGVSLDLMRRDRRSINGLVEALVTTLVERAPEFGLNRISLNFAMFRTVFAEAEKFGAGPVIRLNNAVLGVLSRFFQLESLYRSNEKYRPQWVPRYLCIDSPLSLVRVAIAAGVAEGFLPQWGRNKKLTAFTVDSLLVQQVAEAEVEAHAAARLTTVRRPREQERIRRHRLALLEASGMPGYPAGVPRTGPLPELLDRSDGAQVSITGRIQSLRDFGGVCFAELAGAGVAVQLLLERDRLQRAVTATDPDGITAMDLWRRAVDRGDIISVTGSLGRSRSGQRSVIVTDWRMAAKALRPLPPRRKGLSDPATRARNRSVHLILNPAASEILVARSAAVSALRKEFADRGFREVETPILQNVHGGATARPFTTHINAYDRELSLRIAPELFLKRLVVGGSGPIFEIGRNFRNEGVDATHNPEFTSLEAYLPFADYSSMRVLTVEVIRAVAVAVHGAPVAMRPTPGGLEAVDLSATWSVKTVHSAVSDACGTPIDAATPAETLQRIAIAKHVAAPDDLTAGQLVMQLYEALVESTTIAPTFYTDFPIETSPLTRPHRADPRLAERWDLVAFGMEIGTAYSELTDPIDQRARLTRQSLLAAAGDEEAMEIDEDFLTSLEVGMPPTGGLGLGVDRIVMMLTGAPIRSVLSFPFVRPLGRKD